MKGFAVILLCAFVAVQARSSGVQRDSLVNATPAALGENPWVVHLRVAVSFSGQLYSCAGTIIDHSWVLTAASCLRSATFIWIRYGVVDVPNPELVIETTNINRHLSSDLALVGANRHVEWTDNINAIPITAAHEHYVKFCSWGANPDGSAGQNLKCDYVDLAHGLYNSVYDLGAPLTSHGKLVCIVDDYSVDCIRPAQYLPWINEQTGLQLTADDANERKVIVVNH